MFPSLIQRKEAEAYTRSRFRQIGLERIFVRRCYEEWIEVWEMLRLLSFSLEVKFMKSRSFLKLKSNLAIFVIQGTKCLIT